MKQDGKGTDRSTFLKDPSGAAAGLAKATSVAGGQAEGATAQSGEGSLADLPLHRLSAMIRNREITSKQLVELYLQRLQRFDGRNGINSYITVAAENALGDAEELDKLAQRGLFKGMLHGLPIAVKDNLDTKNMRTTGGSSILANWTPPADASVVAKLKAAGAIVIGKTNMHEFARGITTNNPHYGPTRNPYDKSRIPGGLEWGVGCSDSRGFMCRCTRYRYRGVCENSRGPLWGGGP